MGRPPLLLSCLNFFRVCPGRVEDPVPAWSEVQPGEVWDSDQDHPGTRDMDTGVRHGGPTQINQNWGLDSVLRVRIRIMLPGPVPNYLFCRTRFRIILPDRYPNEPLLWSGSNLKGSSLTQHYKILKLEGKFMSPGRIRTWVSKMLRPDVDPK